MVGLKSAAGPRESNEDAALIRNYSIESLQPRYLCLGAIADGMGGHNAGGLASSTAIRTLFEEFDARQAGYSENPVLATGDLLFELFSAANSAVYTIALQGDDLKGMGTTLTAFLAEKRQVFVAHVGDSRLYLARGDSIVQLTQDHTLVENMVKDNVITREEAAARTDSNVITRAIGAYQTVEIDFFFFPTMPDDIILLCTDGLYRVVDPQEMLQVLKGSPDMQSVGEELVRLAIERGTSDNVTVLLWVAPEKAPVPPAETSGQKMKMNGVVLVVILIVLVAIGFVLGWLIAGWL
jgi:serine/threonine protein phosphatase PrpC